MNNKSTAVRVAAALAVALLVSMALPASAHHDDKAGKVHKDPDGKITYVNAGLIGDNFIQCIGGVSATLFPNGAGSVQVIVDDPTNEGAPSLVDETVPIPGGPYGPIPLVDIPDQRVCLGGAADSTSDSVPLAIPSHWQVWAEDLVFGAVESASGGAVDIVPSMFARFEASASRSTTTVDPSTCVPPAPATRVCQTTTVSETQFKVLAQLSVCGKAGVSGIDTAAFTDLVAAKGAYDDYELSKAVFVNGPVFFSLDCGAGGATLKPVYDDFVHWYNNDPSNPPTGPFGSVPQVPSTCNPGVQGIFVCLFELPIGGSKCWSVGEAPNAPWSNSHEVAPGIIGTIGWNHDDPSANLDCVEDLIDGPWTKTTGTSNGFQVQHFPVSVIIHP